MIRRVVYPELPPKVEYFLTDSGQTLIPVLEAMENWGSQFIPKVLDSHLTPENKAISEIIGL